ncbi:hypothetical protein V8E53_003592 [Lactarius tabidus]
MNKSCSYKHVLWAAHIPGVQLVQDEVLEHPPLQPAAIPGAVSLPVAQECEPTEHDKNFSNPPATPGNLRVDPAPPAKAEGVTGNHMTAHTWIWEECAPSYSDTQMQEGKENTVNLSSDEFNAANMLMSELDRLQVIHNIIFWQLLWKPPFLLIVYPPICNLSVEGHAAMWYHMTTDQIWHKTGSTLNELGWLSG